MIPKSQDSTTDTKLDIPTQWGRSFDRVAERLCAEVVRFRRHFHSRPEPSGNEVETTKFILSQLESLGFSGRSFRSDGGLDVGVAVDIELGEPDTTTPRIAIRCDMDALRIPDEKIVPYRSQNEGIAHACGHDAHSAIVLGIAHAVSGMPEYLAAATSDSPSDPPASGSSETPESPALRLRLLFQPAEEITCGAKWLVAQGAMEGVDAVIGLHVDPERPVGEAGIRYGTLTANCDEVDIELRGHGGHSARPHHSRDPIAATVQLLSALYQNLPRSVDSRDPSVFTVGRINGGYAPNVISENTVLQGSLRTIAESSRTTLKCRMQEICDGVAQSTGVQIGLKFTNPLAAVENDPRVAEALEIASATVLGASGAKRIDRPSLGGEDFSVYLERAPGALLRLGCAAPDTDAPFLHSPVFDIDERCLVHGMRILFRAAVLLSTEATALIEYQI